MKSDSWIYILIMVVFILLAVISIVVYRGYRSEGAGIIGALTTLSTLLSNFATPILALAAIFLTVQINRTLINQAAQQEKNNQEHSKSLALMSIRLEIFKDLKVEYDKMIALTQRLPFPQEGIIPEETILVYRIWDDKIKQFESFFPETFSSGESNELQRLLADLQIRQSPSMQRDILNAYDQFIARMAAEITEATIVERQTVIVEKADGSTEEYRIGE